LAEARIRRRSHQQLSGKYGQDAEGGQRSHGTRSHC
jgi:hypothetical protein